MESMMIKKLVQLAGFSTGGPRSCETWIAAGHSSEFEKFAHLLVKEIIADLTPQQQQVIKTRFGVK